jgi:hypothetical protein
MKSFKIPSLKPIRFKKPYRFVLGGLLIAYALNSCSLFGDTEPTLPPATQTGAETFGCLVNGKVFVARGGGNYPGLTKDYDGGLSIVGIQTTNGNWDASTVVGHQTVRGVGKYTNSNPRYFRHSDKNRIAGGYGNDGKNVPISSELIITKFERGEDKPNNLRWLIVSGTFEAVLTADDNPLDTIRITQGRFDVKFN